MKELDVSVATFDELMSLRLRDWDEEVITDRVLYARAKLCGAAWSLKDGEVLVACTGIEDYWVGMGEVWILCDRIVFKYPGPLLKACAGIIDMHMERERLWRIQAHCRADWDKANAFTKKLGFRKEAYLKYYGPHQIDYNLWALFKRWD